MKQQITGNEENLFFEENAQVSVVTLTKISCQMRLKHVCRVNLRSIPVMDVHSGPFRPVNAPKKSSFRGRNVPSGI